MNDLDVRIERLWLACFLSAVLMVFAVMLLNSRIIEQRERIDRLEQRVLQ